MKGTKQKQKKRKQTKKDAVTVGYNSKLTWRKHEEYAPLKHVSFIRCLVRIFKIKVFTL